MFWERIRLGFFASRVRTSQEEMQDRRREGQDPTGQDEKEHANLTNNMNDNRHKVADTFVDTKFKQLAV